MTQRKSPTQGSACIQILSPVSCRKKTIIEVMLWGTKRDLNPIWTRLKGQVFNKPLNTESGGAFHQPRGDGNPVEQANLKLCVSFWTDGINERQHQPKWCNDFRSVVQHTLLKFLPDLIEKNLFHSLWSPQPLGEVRPRNSYLLYIIFFPFRSMFRLSFLQ